MTSSNLSAGALAEHAQRFELLVAGISDYAIYMLSLDGLVTSWNAGAQRFKGYEASEIIGRHFSIFYSPEERAAGTPAASLRTALVEGRFEAEGWRWRKDGSRFWASVVIDSIRNHEGELIGFAKITRDITERRLAQDALRDSERRFRMLVQGVTDYAIYMLSVDGLVTNWNAGAERIKGYSAGEALGSHFARFHTREDQDKGVPQQTLAIAAEVGRFETEAWRVRKDGSRFWAHVVIDAIHEDDGTLMGFAKITRDITEKKLAAEMLEQANAALFQSQKMEAIGQLTGGIAHDFNNLLAVLSSGLDVLALRLAHQGDTAVTDSMQRAVKRGALLTQQLLSFARQQALDASPHNLNEIIGGFEAVLRRAGHASIVFSTALDPALRLAMVDAPRFEATLLNLAVNARDAMPDGGTLLVRTANVRAQAGQIPTLDAGDYVRVSVSDSGTGMTPEVAKRAFDPFYTTKDVGKGTGLGLSQVYGFISQSGGAATVSSEPGAGTTVDLFLPALPAGAFATHAAEERGKDTVLIVEDERDILLLATELFRSLGYHVLTANNGDDGWEIAERVGHIDLLFTDVMMPEGMNGIELAKRVRTKYPRAKVMITSGYTQLGVRGDAGSLDGFLFVDKPYRLSDLARTLRAG
ncbi:MAG TPA: hybrid sensor histidine kinase/response regulator [Janthinobacterium sp.]|nr:hybrid sensor histidine kinase/response regulator [Janthinobacterium sp.]